MKWRIFFFFLFFSLRISFFVLAQNSNARLLHKKLTTLKQQANYKSDTAYINALNQLATIYADSYPDSALAFLPELIENCKNLHYISGEVYAYTNTGNAYQTKGDFEKALANYEHAYQISLNNKMEKGLPGILNNIGLVHTNQGNYVDALNKYYEAINISQNNTNKLFIASVLNNIAIVHFYQGKMHEADSAYHIMLKIALELNDSLRIIYAYNNIGEVNLEQNNIPDALENFTKGQALALLNNNPEMQTAITNNLGNAYLKSNKLKEAQYQFDNALALARQKDYGLAICKALIGLANVKYQQQLYKEALTNGLEGLQKAKEMGQTQLLRDANKLVSSIYEKLGDSANGLIHFKLFKQYSDSLNNLANERAAANERANYQVSQNRIQFEKETLQQRWIIFSAFAALLTLCVIIWIINRNKKRLNKTNIDLQQKNELIAIQKQETEATLSQLKATQAQLIQAEKMASLGELTAGIAHEIQNPLNFVNNFSELSKELLDEAKEALEKENITEAKDLMNEVIKNVEKINNHGNRADGIVKGMLQHSRSSTGQKELTDINHLADEYLRLSYHGLRAKDKSFNASIETNFDPLIPKSNIVAQDIGRVLLNLLNNAFYAVNEKKVLENNSDSNYQPKVTICTRKKNNHIEIEIKDNGNGIPEKIISKIFQPFFTTKPTGLGTGLGLSLSYEIVKAHGGEITVAAIEREGTTFIINIPA